MIMQRSLQILVQNEGYEASIVPPKDFLGPAFPIKGARIGPLKCLKKASEFRSSLAEDPSAPFELK